MSLNAAAENLRVANVLSHAMTNMMIVGRRLAMGWKKVKNSGKSTANLWVKSLKAE